MYMYSYPVLNSFVQIFIPCKITFVLIILDPDLRIFLPESIFYFVQIFAFRHKKDFHLIRITVK